MLLEVVFLNLIISCVVEYVLKLNKDPTYLLNNLYFLTPFAALIIYLIIFSTRRGFLFKAIWTVLALDVALLILFLKI